MKAGKIITGAVLLMNLLSAQAQNPASRLSYNLSEHGLDFDYSYVYNTNGLKINGDGHVTAQNDAFRMTGNGMVMACDGRTRWTVDEEAMECYIEGVDASNPDLTANPALMVLSVDKYCKLADSSRKTFKGKIMSAYNYTALNKDVPFLSAEFFFDGDVPVGMILKLRDGSSLELEIKGYKIAGPQSLDPAVFVFDTSTLGADYVITDFR